MSLACDYFSLEGPFEPREQRGITFIGPDFFATDEKGELLSRIGTVFPRYRAIVTVKGIHAYHVSILADFLRLKMPEKERPEPEVLEESICMDAVPLIFRDNLIIVRSDPAGMENVFAADQMLQIFFQKERIQFTGLNIAEIRMQLRHRGECWRMSPTPRSVVEICRYLRASKVKVGTGLTVYSNEPTGDRFLTFEEFMQIRPLICQDLPEALARIREILNLSQCTNMLGNRELSLLLPAGKHLDLEQLEIAASIMEQLPVAADAGGAIKAFDRFAALFAEAAGPELVKDDYTDPVWRTTMFCRLLGIDEEEMEELALELSPEFHLNVKWLPGASVVDGLLRFDAGTHLRTQGLIEHYWQHSGGLRSINIGQIQESQSARDISGEEREVYLVAMTNLEGIDSLRIIRLMKWDVIHRIKMGIPLDQAVEETFKYRDYIFDRLYAAVKLGFPILAYSEIRLQQQLPGIGSVPAFFFERQYVTGVVSDKLPISCYKSSEFIESLACLLGLAAAFTLVLGRVSFRTGKVFYDDGDELIQLGADSIPCRLVIIETTGSFTDCTTPMQVLLPQCLERFRLHLQKAADTGVSPQVLDRSVAAFADGLSNRIEEIKRALSEPSSQMRSLFDDRPAGQGGIRDKWKDIIERIEAVEVNSLRNCVLNTLLLPLPGPKAAALRSDSVVL
ncbi:MAG: hypothetical protein ACP5IL_04125 [Syntrophobacteraceae bacterium]